MDTDATIAAELPPRVLPASRDSRLTIFGDVAERHVIFAIEVSPAMASALPAVKTDLIESLLRLAYRGDADTSFNLLRFGGGELVQWSDRLVLATPRTATVAAQWIRDLHPDSGSRGAGLLDALSAAMSDPACQAVHLITTGATATASCRHTNPLDSLRQRLGGSSRLRPVHCAVCLPVSDGLNQLCELAAATGGTVASVQLGDDDAGGVVQSVTRLLTADRPSARLSRDASGRLRNSEPPVGASPAASSRAMVLHSSSGATKTLSVPEATLVGRSVLARRRSAGGAFYRGQVVSEVSPRVLLVEFPAASAELESSERQETPLADLISLDDALRRSAKPGDFVLAPPANNDGSSGAYRPARVLRTGPQLTVAMAGPSSATEVRRLSPGSTAWIPRELYCSLELEALAAAAQRLEETPAPLEGGSDAAQSEPKADATVTQSQEDAAPLTDEATAAVEVPVEEAKEGKEANSELPNKNIQDAFDQTQLEPLDGEAAHWFPADMPPSKPRLRRRQKRQPAQAVMTETETPRVEAYRRAMEEARSAKIRRRRAELRADGLLRDPSLRRNEAAAIAAATAAASLSSRGALHTAAVIEARLSRQERREAAELRLAERDAEVARQRRWGDPRGYQQPLRVRPEPPPPPEVLRLRWLQLLAGDGQQPHDGNSQTQLAKPDRTIAEWLLYQRLANGGSPISEQQWQLQELQQQQDRQLRPLTAKEWLRMARRAELMSAAPH